MKVDDWLRSLGLGQYEAAFRDNAIEADILSDLTESDLEKLGLPLGHRKRLLKAIAALDAALAAANAPAVSPVQPPADAAERRQLTVMFCDLVGSTALSARLDPEDMRGVIGAYHRCCASQVERSGGFVAKYMGDGVLAYFGYPQAHENDAERAVQAGLSLVESLPRLETAAAVPLQARVGIATGMVVVGDLIGSGAAQERGVVGDTPNLAARLQAFAKPGTVVVGEGTRRLLGNLFELDDLGPQELKGIEGAPRAWAALRPSNVASRFEALRAGDSLTDIVARDEEAELLLRRWSKAERGEGQVALIAGEAGIGKSRLTAGLIEDLAAKPHMRLRYFCSPQHADSVLHPVITQMERAAGLAYDDAPQVRLDKLDALLRRASTPPESMALIAELLSLPNDGRYPTLELAPPQRRQRTLQALMAQLEALARQTPLLMLFEDAHWSDPTSLELFSRTVDRIAALPVLLVVTYRPEFNPPWVGRSNVAALTLNRLTHRDVGAMIDRIVGNKELPASLRQEIIERTDGVPLFVEEMTKAMLEAENESEARKTAAAIASSGLAVPATLYASLAARLDRLGPAKEIAQIGAAIGREFPHALIATVARKPEAELGAALDRLVQAGLVSQQGTPPHASYLFKHALVQDAAYGMLLREPRRALHARIAETLESQFTDLAEVEPEILAHHFSRADLPARACACFERAGDRAVTRSAYAEAVAHFNACLVQAARLPAGPERSRIELPVLLKLGPAVLIFKGWQVSGEMEQIYERAYDAAQALGDGPRLFKALWGLWFCANLSRRTGLARERAEALVALAQQAGSDELFLEAIHCRWSSAFFRGDVHGSIDDAREGLKLYDPERHAKLGAEYGGHDAGVCAYSCTAVALAQLGQRREAADCVERAIELSQRLKQPSSLTFAIMNSLTTYTISDDRAAVTQKAAQMVELAERFNLPPQRSIATFFRGWAMASGNSLNEGLAVMEAEYPRVSALGPLPLLYSGMLGAVRLEAGQIRPAFDLLDAAVKSVKEPGANLYLPEVRRLRGECLLRLDAANLQDAARDFEAAIGMAKEQDARIYRLAAALSLALASAGGPGNGLAELRSVVSDLRDADEMPLFVQARQLLAAHH